MIIDRNVKKLGIVPQNLIDDFAQILHTVDWNHADFDRTGDYLKARTVFIPTDARPHPYQVDSEQIISVRQGFDPLKKWINEVFSGDVFIKYDINYIPSKICIPYHYDHCWFHEYASRVHIPIISNANAFWMAREQKCLMPVGYYYEVNNRELHSFYNNGEAGRIHAVIDIMKPDVYNKAIAENIDLNSTTIETVYIDPKEILGDNYLDE